VQVTSRRRWTALALLGLLTACGTTVPTSQIAQQQAEALRQTATTDQGRTGGPTSGGLAPGGTAGAVVSGTTGATSSVAPGSGTVLPSSAPAASTSGLPAKGRGWDEKNVYIGVPTVDDFNETVKGLGATASGGDTHGQVDAVVADINRSGGLFGRKVVAVYKDSKTTDVAYNPASTSQAVCTYFTQDRPVIGVVNGLPQFDAQASFHQCLEHAGVSLLSLSNTDYDDADYARLGPHLWTTASLSTDSLIPTFIGALHRQKFFTGWDTVNGRAGAAPVKVGILLLDTPQGRHVGGLMLAALKGLSIAVADPYYYDASGLGTASQSEVLQLQSAQVTHVLDLPPIAAEIWFFQGAAERQRYRPRYGFTSFNLPLSVEENAGLVPPRQQVGSMGIGWQPFNDTNATHDAGPMPGSARCLGAMRRGGQTFSSSARRAALIATQICDAIYLIKEAAVAGKGLDGAALLAGMPLAGPRLATAGTFQSVLTTQNHGVPGYYRDQQYQAACSCFVYVGPKHPFVR
jgi:hypothetical protein